MTDMHPAATTPTAPRQEAPPVDPARFHRPAAAVALITLGVYVLTLAPDLSWANGAYDGAELITASATLGVPHPPGYPAWVLLGKFFSLLPLGTVAFRYNLFSAVSAAAASGVFVLVAGVLYPMIRPAAAMSAALLFAFAPLVWSQALVAEVYSLNLLAVSIFLLVWSRRGANAFSGFWLGLAITTHLTSVFWLPAMVIRGRRRWLRIGAGMALGLSPLLLLPWLASRNSPIVWGQPVDPTGWWWLVSGRIYNANIQPTVNVGRWLALLQAIALGPAAVLASSAGDDSRSRPATGDTRPTPLLFIGTSLLYVAFVLFYDTPDAAVLLLPAFLILALLAAPLLERLGDVVWLLPITLVALTFGARELRGQKPEQSPRVLAEGILRSAPENALLLTPGDRTIFTLLYFQQVEGARSDLRLADANLFAFDWYRIRLRERYPDVSIPVEDDLEALWRENGSSRPFCLVGLVEPPPEAFIMAAAGRLERGTGAPWLSCVEEMD